MSAAALTFCSSDVSITPDGSASIDAIAVDQAAAERDAATHQTCPAGSKEGPAGSTDGLVTSGGIRYNVRTPDAYDPLVEQPLIVVFAPSGGSAATTEQSTGLTSEARQAGHVIAYVDHVSPVSISGAEDIAAIPALIAERWCIDPSRIYLSGSSDGGSVIYTMLLNDMMFPLPAAIAPFAAGASSKTLGGAPCMQQPMPVMILHNEDDTVFPGFGKDARDWWIACNGCNVTGGEPLADGCIPYGACREDAEVQYCEGTGGHGGWPDLNRSMIAFFERFRRPQ